VQTVWPEFDWEAAYASFFSEYSRLCTVEELEDDRALELVARCVVETGTATYYQTLRDLTDEPVLAELTEHIRTDEVQHYKHFYRYFKEINAERNLSRAAFSARSSVGWLSCAPATPTSRCVMSGCSSPTLMQRDVPFEHICQRLYHHVAHGSDGAGGEDAAQAAGAAASYGAFDRAAFDPPGAAGDGRVNSGAEVRRELRASLPLHSRWIALRHIPERPSRAKHSPAFTLQNHGLYCDGQSRIRPVRSKYRACSAVKWLRCP
jgi:hypothetical protein